MVLGDRRLEWCETAEPKLLQPTDALVHPVALSICDADVAYLKGAFPTRDEFCFGHEFVADVIETGSQVSGFAVGDRVVVSFLIACGTCERCKRGFPAACTTVPQKSAYGFGIFGDWGGAACDVIRVPYADTMMVKLPPGVSAVDAASVGDNLSDAFRCVEEGLLEEPGAPVLIVAGDGGAPSISLYAAVLARALGSEQVDFIDSDPTRLALAESVGANPIEMRKAPSRHGSYPVTVATSGHPSGEWLSAALRSTAPYGRCTSCGVYHGCASLPVGAMYDRGVRFTIGWTNVQALMPKVLDLLARKKVPVERIHTVAPWGEAIDALENPPAKLVLTREASS
ncbi:MAG: alcohol dehydrogenase catalytic domain-containing protein [Chthoniobacterales bacterium]|nr:alcohol dehydrogenase catalytic domain-containing protein [Chthoniobacterales bacterium]